MENLFQIQNVYCAYNSKKAVLEITKLNIPENKLIFIIGPSGVGKSTLLEALGLMNHTAKARDDSHFIFQPGNNDTELNFLNIWGKSDNKISQIRNHHFSFVFQNTELMGNLSPFENAYIPLLIQGYTKVEAREKVKNIIQKLNMSAEIDDSRQVTDFSIGQRQRLAFVRAITPEFTVLFGDEPTGNLDRPNAYRLMKTLKESIKDRNTSAIIVSHDLELAIDFADMIILINKEQDKDTKEITTKGVINQDSIFIHDYESKLWNNRQARYSEKRLKGFFEKAIE